MKSTIGLAPVSILKSLNNLFIELTAKNCSQRCKHCYINFPMNKHIKDFISVETIKKALNESCHENIKCICLTGAEPMTHPDFNTILRLCLKRCSVCIFTNAACINEKKARFLKKVEDESEFQIIFKLSIDHYNEVKSDDIRGRGTYRQTLHAIKALIKYDFNPILCITNYYRENPDTLIREFQKICTKIGYNTTPDNFVVNECFDASNPEEEFLNRWNSLDCEYGRILTEKGIYSCPFLANDHRGRCGSSFLDYAKKTSLESPYCQTCIKNNQSMFGFNFSQ